VSYRKVSMISFERRKRVLTTMPSV